MMPALNFQKRFAPLVESGDKLQTIRANRKRPFVKGDRLYLYTGMRTASCRKLGEAVATKVTNFEIAAPLIVIGERAHGSSEPVIKRLAKDDGFESVVEMIDWFRKTHGLPFVGQLIQWDSVSPPTGPEDGAK